MERLTHRKQRLARSDAPLCIINATQHPQNASSIAMHISMMMETLRCCSSITWKRKLRRKRSEEVGEHA